LVIAKQTVYLLFLINNHSLSCKNQQDVVSRFAELAVDACSLSFQVSNDVFEALELMKLRCEVIMSLLIDN